MKLKNTKFKNKTGEYRYDISSGILRHGKTENGNIDAMRNFSYEVYPYLKTYAGYGNMTPDKSVSAIGSAGGDIFCTLDSGFYYNGERKLDVENEVGFFTVFKNNVIIHSDGVYYDTASGMIGSIEKEFGAAAVKCINGFGEESSCGVNMMTSDSEGTDLTEIFSVGDRIFVPEEYGVRYMGEHTVRAIDKERSALVFDPCEFGYAETQGGISVTVKIPEFSQTCVCHDRIWGFCGGTVRACAKGNMFEWYKTDGEDSAFSAEVGDLDEFIGCIEYEGYPVFFTKNKIYKVYGDNACNFSLRCCSSVSGLLSGHEGSIAYAGDEVFYLAGDKVMRFSGGQATLEADIFDKGEKSFVSAVSYDGKYILSYLGASGENARYVYDSISKTWCRYDSPVTKSFFELSGKLYALTEGGDIAVFDGGGSETDGFAYTDNTAQLSFERARSKFPIDLLRVELDVETDGSSEVSLSVGYDDDEDYSGKARVEVVKDQRIKLCLPPRRCRAWRLKLEINGSLILKSVEAIYTYT